MIYFNGNYYAVGNNGTNDRALLLKSKSFEKWNTNYIGEYKIKLFHIIFANNTFIVTGIGLGTTEGFLLSSKNLDTWEVISTEKTKYYKIIYEKIICLYL